MSPKYLLPCSSCQEKIPIEVHQAGQQIECACGANLEVPTLTGIRALQRAEPSPEGQRPTSKWEARHGVLLVGAVMTVVALGLTTFVYVSRPKLLEMEDMGPFETWLAWQFLREGVRRPSFEANAFQAYLAALQANRRWMAVSLSCVAFSLMVMAGSALVPKRRLRRRIVRVPAQESRVLNDEPPPDDDRE